MKAAATKRGSAECDVNACVKRVADALAQHALFSGSCAAFLEGVASRAQHRWLEAGEDLMLGMGDSLYMVEHGAVSITVGNGPAVNLGSGTALNATAMLGCRTDFLESTMEDPPYEPRAGLLGAEAPHIAEACTLDRALEVSKELDGDNLCFYALCPLAADTLATDWDSADEALGSDAGSAVGDSILRVVAAQADAVPRVKCSRAEFSTGGASISMITADLVRDVASRFTDETVVSQQFRSSVQAFERNAKEIQGIWQSILRLGRPMFGGLPPEVAWAIAEISERVETPDGELLTKEGLIGEHGECIFILEQGQASVEKMEGVTLYETKQEELGRLRPGAIIGDLRTIGCRVPRPASVRSVGGLRAVRLSASGLLDVLQSFPGVLTGLKAPLDSWASLVRSRPPLGPGDLPKPYACARELLSFCSAFSGCSSAFLDQIAGMAQWLTVRCGEVLTIGEAETSKVNRRSSKGRVVPELEASSNFNQITDTEYTVAYGRFGVQAPGRGLIRELVVGSSFSGSEVSKSSRQEVCALTPVALALMVHQGAIAEALRRHPDHVEIFQKRTMLSETRAAKQALRQAEVFRKCGSSFLDAICGAVEITSYLPGQTLTVRGARDASQMFLLRSGLVTVERNGIRLSRKSAGAAMGELMMLGIVASRSATMRAMTFCIVLEVPRAAFMNALEDSPEERESFEQLAMQHIEMRTIWPFLKDCSQRLHLFLNMRAQYREMEAGDQRLRHEGQHFGILLMNGTAAIMSAEGKELSTLAQGQCFNEQVLLGIPSSSSYLVPTSHCEFQLLPEDIWKRLKKEFPEEQDDARQHLLRYLCQGAERRRGLEPSSTTPLRASGLFRTASQELLTLVQGVLKGSIFSPGQVVVKAGQVADYMLLLVEGRLLVEHTARADASQALLPVGEFVAGSIMGEAILAGAAKTYPRTMRASQDGPCLFQVLHRSDFREVLAQRPLDRAQFEALVWKDPPRPGFPDPRQEPDVLAARLHGADVFGSGTTGFSARACQDAEDIFFAPGEVIIESGEECVVGVTPCYVLLVGQATVETSEGIFLGTVQTGSLFGEAGALGLASSRTARVRASRVGLVHCAKLHGHYVQAAVRLATPQEEKTLKENFQHRQAANGTIMRKRAAWVDEVVPRIRTTRLFADWPLPLLQALVVPLEEASFAPGEVISTAGEPASSMLVVLEGVVHLETAAGEYIGQLHEGATIGEVAAMGLFNVRIATCRATSDASAPRCRMLSLPAEALHAALVAPGAENVREQLEKVVADRNDQVQNGLPISALPISVPPEDVTARAVALQAERLELAAGEAWQPAPDEGPCGPHYCVFVKGKACLEVMADSRVVMPLSAGSLLLEGQAYAWGTQVRALSTCEAYRVRHSDFAAAACSVKSSQDWFYRFRLFEKTVREEANFKLRNALGCSRSLTPHPKNSEQLQSWKGNRQRCIDRAEEKRKAWCELRNKSLPRVSSAPSGVCREAAPVAAPAHGTSKSRQPSVAKESPREPREAISPRSPSHPAIARARRVVKDACDTAKAVPAIVKVAAPLAEPPPPVRPLDLAFLGKEQKLPQQQLQLLDPVSPSPSSKAAARRTAGPGRVQLDTQALGGPRARDRMSQLRLSGTGRCYCW